MIDVETNRPIRVSAEGTGGSYIIVPLSQLENIRSLLERNHIYFWVDEDAISLDGKPEIAVINLGANGNAQIVQAILDQS